MVPHLQGLALECSSCLAIAELTFKMFRFKTSLLTWQMHLNHHKGLKFQVFFIDGSWSVSMKGFLKYYWWKSCVRSALLKLKVSSVLSWSDLHWLGTSTYLLRYILVRHDLHWLRLPFVRKHHGDRAAHQSDEQSSQSYVWPADVVQLW